jgi:hypothetical protein
MVSMEGLEPSRPNGHKHLKLARLPIPPHRLVPLMASKNCSALLLEFVTWDLGFAYILDPSPSIKVERDS